MREPTGLVVGVALGVWLGVTVGDGVRVGVGVAPRSVFRNQLLALRHGYPYLDIHNYTPVRTE